MTPNAGYNAGIAQTSQLKRIGWALKGGPTRKKDLRLNTMGAVAEGRKLRNRVNGMMQEAGWNPDNAMVFCVFAEADLSALTPEALFLPVKDTGAGELKAALDHADKLPIGFLVYVIDVTEAVPSERLIGHARPLIVEDPRGRALNEAALEMYRGKIVAKLEKGGISVT